MIIVNKNSPPFLKCADQNIPGLSYQQTKMTHQIDERPCNEVMNVVWPYEHASGVLGPKYWIRQNWPLNNS